MDADLLVSNISPDQLILRWKAGWSDHLNTLLQAKHAFDRSFDESAYNFGAYTLVDASARYRLPVGQLSAGGANLFNKD